MILKMSNNHNNNNNISSRFANLYEIQQQQQQQQQQDLQQQQQQISTQHLHHQHIYHPYYNLQQQQQQQHEKEQERKDTRINLSFSVAATMSSTSSTASGIVTSVSSLGSTNNNHNNNRNNENILYTSQQLTSNQMCSNNESLSTKPTTTTTTAAAAAAAATNLTTTNSSSAKSERESIHSGHFMVSQFEAEDEAQDDLVDSVDEVNMSSLSTQADESNTCMEVQLYVPRKVAELQYSGGGKVDYNIGSIASHVEIETSLTKLFKCMSLAYSQKLTSPKWNHFKGVRLRWKDKIRLNNVIWRCWHMQFILKKRTPVCQFASPLDVDIHSNPESVVLEGKYWKRQLAVIKAEYRKWRRNFKSKAIGSLTYDTKSEFDLLDWSPSFMLSDDWTSDTLFSAINGPFPFPDPREIARAGIADFIQPSLGPLQPNLEDIDVTFQELLQSTRLPPVPEEGTDDYAGFQAIMGPPEQMDATSIMEDVVPAAINVPTAASSSTSQVAAMNVDTNMLELNTPLNALQYSEIDQQYGSNSGANQNSAAAGDALMSDTLLQTVSARGKHYGNMSDNQRQATSEYASGKSVIKGRISKNIQRIYRREPHNYDKAQPTFHQTTIYQQILAEQQKTQLQPNNVVNTGATATFPTGQPQQQQQLWNQQYTTATASNASGSVAEPDNYVYGQTSDSSGMLGLQVNPMNVKTTATNYGRQPQQQQQTGNKMLNVKIEPPCNEVLSMFDLSSGNASNAVTTTVADDLVYSNTTTAAYKPYMSGNNLQQHQHLFKKSSSTGTFVNIRNLAPAVNNYLYTQQQQQQQQTTMQQQQQMQHTHSLPLNIPTMSNLVLQQQQQRAQLLLPPPPSAAPQQQQQQQQQQISPTNSLQMVAIEQQKQQLQQQQQQVIYPKEMFRSNSLPLNVTLQKADNFVVPKYPQTGMASGRSTTTTSAAVAAAAANARARSNSIQPTFMMTPSGQSGLDMSNNLAALYGSNTATLADNNVGRANNSLLIAPTLQTATSDPMLNSTLAQLLTSNTRIKSHNLAPPAGSNNLGLNAVRAQQNVQRQLNLQQPQSKSPKKSQSLPAPVPPTLLHSPPNKMKSFPLTGMTTACSMNTLTGSSSGAGSSSTHLSLSPDSFHEQDSPLSPTHSLSKFPRESQRRAGHIHAEQKRRYNIKNGFDMLHSLIPQLQQNPNNKLSKAAMLQKGAEHIKHLRCERNLLQERMETLRQERDALNNSLTHLHSILPANGAPVTRQGTEHVRQLYEQYVRYRTIEHNWKFWILGLILEPLLSSYTTSVSSASMDEMRRTAFLWVDQHCSLIDLRPAVSNKLKYLSMKTDILSDPPSTLEEEVAKAVNHTAGQHPNLHGT